MNIFSKIILPIIALALPAAASAADMSLSASPASVGAGKLVEITMSISSDASVNTFAGTLRFPPSLLIPVSVSDGNSIVSLWVTRPAFGNGNISFAGVTPGGFSGRQGKLMSIVFKTAAPGKVELSFADLEVLRSDGAGTNEPVTAPPFMLSIASGSADTWSEPADTDPPEPFNVSLGNDPHLFGGSTYAIFSAVDKGSGVDHYETAETRWPWAPSAWQSAESPSAVHDQYLTSDTYVKAVDRAGNARIAVVHRKYLLRPVEGLAGSILVILAGVWYIGRARRRTL